MSDTLLNPYFGDFGGMYVPEILVPVLKQLEKAFVDAKQDPGFQAEFSDLLQNYAAGRPLSPSVEISPRAQKPNFILNAKICCTAALTKPIRF